MPTVGTNLRRVEPSRELTSALLAPADRSVASRARRVADLLLIWHQRARQRRQLECLNDRMLRDIGLTRADVVAESSKPFWRL